MPTYDLYSAQAATGEDKFQLYGCLDVTGTLEIFNILHARLSPAQDRIYRWSRAQQNPALAMSLRGVRVNTIQRMKAQQEMRLEVARIVRELQADPLVVAHWSATTLETGACREAPERKGGKPGLHKWPRPKKGEPPIPEAEKKCERCGASRVKPAPFEPGSPTQLARLFYQDLRVPKRYSKLGSVTTNDEALEAIGEAGIHVGQTKTGKWQKRALPGLRDLCEKLRTFRDASKQLDFLQATLTPAERFPSSFNVAAAWTGRWSSSKNPYGEGGNLQNISERHRHIFLPDPGRRLFYADLKTAESLHVAYLSGDEAYIEAHKGDVHTWVTRALWPDLPWTGDIKQDKKLASSTNPEWDKAPGHDLRFQSKRVQHGSNYGLSPFGLAMIARIPLKAAMEAQEKYFTAFPRIRDWQNHIRASVQAQLPIVNALKREVLLMGRPWDSHTAKQGLAFAPQSGIGDVLNLGLWRLWNLADPHILEVLAQVHDAVMGQYPIENEAEAQRLIAKALMFETPITDFTGITRTCVIQAELAVGGNWGKASETNPNGLKEVPL